MANAEPTGSPPTSSSSTHGSRKDEEKNVDDEEIFDPTDEEIIDNYLKKRVEGQHPPTNFIKEDDAFTTSPAQLFHKYGMKMEDKGYFFSPFKDHVEMKIAADGGFWKYRKQFEVSVFDMTEIAGRIKYLDFFETNQADEELKTNWVMKEYSLQPDAENPSINEMEGQGEEEAEGGGETEEEAEGGDVEEKDKREDENATDMSLLLRGNILNKEGDIVLCKILYEAEKKSGTEVDNEDISSPVDNPDILNDYLNRIVEGRRAPPNSTIDTDDAFISPVELFRRHGIERDEVRAFISPLKESFERRIPTEDGFWKYRNHMIITHETDVNGKERIVLRIKPLDYFEINQAGEELKTNWVMEEHSIPPDVSEAEDDTLVSQAAAPTRVGDPVLCEIRYDTPKPGSRAEEVEEDEEAQGEGGADNEEEEEEEDQRGDDNVDAQTASSSEDVHRADASPQHSGYTWRKLTDDDNVEEDEEAQGGEADKEDESQAEEVEADKADIFAPVDNENIAAPTNEQIRQLAPSNSIIDTDDAFISPVELFRRHGIERDEVGLFYSPVKESFERRIPTDDGFWKYRNHMSTTSEIDVNGIKRIVLRIKPLDYFEINQAGEELKTNWVMEENSLPPDVPEAQDDIAKDIFVRQATAPNKVGDLVLCKIRYDTPNLKQPGSQAEEVEEDREAQGEGKADKEEENQAEEVEEDEEAQGGEEADNEEEEENQRDDDNVDAQTASSSSEYVHRDDISPQHSGYTYRKSADDDNFDAQTASSSEN